VCSTAPNHPALLLAAHVMLPTLRWIDAAAAATVFLILVLQVASNRYLFFGKQSSCRVSVCN